MGSSESKPPLDPLFKDPWRVIDWTTKDELLNFVRNYKPKGASHLRILVYGPVGVGKSSFINSAGALIVGRKVNVAAASASSSDKSFTQKFEAHTFRLEESDLENVPIVFTDVVGLEASENRGAQPEDIKLIMKGHMMDGYILNPLHALPKDNMYFNPNPTVDDKVHVLVCMLNANATGIHESVLKKMKEIRKMARDLDIPQVAVATHIDVACGETDNCIKHVYRSKFLKEKMDLFSVKVGIPIHNIYAVRNNYEGRDRNAADTLILTALKDMVDFGTDCMVKTAM